MSAQLDRVDEKVDAQTDAEKSAGARTDEDILAEVVKLDDLW